MTRIKCCGMTRVGDALLAARLGADAIGLVFTARSRRQVTLARAREIVAALPPFVASVALFMDDEPGLVRQVLDEVRPTLLQFHGNESDAWCAQFGRPFLKAIAMGEGVAALPWLREYPQAAGVLLDGHAAGEAGGSGRTFDWSLLPRDPAQPLVLAGGLHAGNVGEAVRTARPWAVDVASGVESAPGIKDPARLAAFIRAVRAADAA
ncbi:MULTISPECIES: phosphoribosylanthranilate isomerase [Rhodanobacter]|uniref:N-(5'-phosphoribosyl)anthranilate isomerase n=1 Tax=Rhodanobacter denitrificans TaxID=666685 RepID=M4NFV5_9GAMM|nr:MULTISPECIES: phosphoribosylanthranilate isomerase [Rhodanobacter]AGG88498.1 phosphoribosylanthranilate isomerase [Rhodanobacter denitrificans]KZC18657.1 N-(5'-phosphoribosyl)anthranilate isomerase [Rhodanobacter denitrificans]UJJ52383.1 phosphoribosylanthranilate isomerase [Rhodanobacter denitrificans]UJJ58834.1 phosphoribosylanthranilate isomerase [Rhodanobacter denitrificans]UJM87633.1 phosphoribosylanthranilate isomerase [Rhodanobacter denitrificans]